MTPARGRVLRALEDGMVRSKAEAAREAGVSAGVIDGLVDDGALEALVLPLAPVAEEPDPTYDVPELTPAQRTAADALKQAVAAQKFAVTLLDGVTGSGKTEVYFEAVAEAIRAGRQTLILMPEIALTNAVPRPLRGPLRRAAGGMAQPGGAAPPRAHLERRRSGRGRRRRRRALGAVSPLRRARPHHRR